MCTLHWHCCCVIPDVGHSITAWSLVTGCRLSRLISTKYLCLSTGTVSSSPISHDTPQPGTKLCLNYPLRDSIISRVSQYSVFLSGLAAHHQRWSGAREILVWYNLGICFPSRLYRRLGPMKDNVHVMLMVWSPHTQPLLRGILRELFGQTL